ncbi:calcium-binding protein, partial [Streptomyces sp. NPDC059956]|uniref:calcium-binding protein n=1 Tax=Streptomyces sp. NPDC059956 TaxID=3347015 RepID=UPI00365F0DA9
MLALPAAALAAPGELDLTFGGTGMVTADLGGGDVAGAVVVQPDGKIVTAGVGGPNPDFGDFAVARHNPDGSLDVSFGTGGRVTTDFGDEDVAFAVALQADGKIVAAGTADLNTGLEFGMARYNADGSPDTSFGIGGKVTTDLGGIYDSEALKVAVQPDGKIVAAGRGGFEGFDFAVARYNTDGSLDSGFGMGGTVATDPSFGAAGWAQGMALQPDGKIVTAGPGVNCAFEVIRYNTDGSLDTSFSEDGKAPVCFVNTDGAFAYEVAVQPDGKIVTAGWAAADIFGPRTFAVGRLNPDGSPDPSFGPEGRGVTTPFASGAEARAMVLQSDGKIVAAGRTGPSDLDFAVARYMPDGSLDTGYGTGGKVVTDFGNSGAHGLALQADGKAIAVGGEGADFALVRYQDGASTPQDVDMSVTKTGPASIGLGSQATYTVTVTNNSSTSPATGIVLGDTLTGPGTLLSATPSQGTCTTTAQCTLGTLTPGTNAIVTVTVQPTATGTLSD